jgi:hypothetical protein
MADNDARRRAAAAYVVFFESLTPELLSDLEDVVTKDVRFTDPFNDVVGIEAMRGVFKAMFRDVEGPRFRVTRTAFDGDCCLVKWIFTGRSRLGEMLIEGTSELEFDEWGRVRRHVDFWDAAGSVYERIPVIGQMLRFIRRRIGAGPPPA